MVDSVMAYTLETAGDFIIASNPSQRIGRPEDVGGVAVFLASAAGSWVNGATITLDGGAIVSSKPMTTFAKL